MIIIYDHHETTSQKRFFNDSIMMFLVKNMYIYGRVYFVPVIEGPAARREHNFQKLVSIGEMLLFFGNDELCSRRAAPATETT